jgi:hypothetical protein
MNRTLYNTLTMCLVGASTANFSPAAEPSELELQQQFTASVRPFVQTYCQSCHGAEKPEGKLNLEAFTTATHVAKDHRTWQAVLERVAAGEMPPEEAQPQPSTEQRRAVVEWLRAFRRHEAHQHAGDPGPVVARRLSNAEYNYTIRDLTGVDIRPTQEFPVDPANEAGFDNSGESLTMSAALLQKYLGAARMVAEHLVLKPDGLAFAPHAVVTDTDRDKYCVKRIVDFYKRQPTDYADYFHAAWHYRRREQLGQPDATLADVAVAKNISPKYLALVWSTLTETNDDVGPLAKLRALWRELPLPHGPVPSPPSAGERVRERGPSAHNAPSSGLRPSSPPLTGEKEPGMPAGLRSGCEQMRDYVVTLRRKLEPSFPDLSAAGIHKGSQTFVLWKNRQYAASRRNFNRDSLQVRDLTKTDDEIDVDLVVPSDETDRARHEAAFARFCSVFPDAFYVSERGRDYLGKPKDEQEKGRLLSAGFHSMMGYFRDDGPLCELILGERDKAELDALWQELDFITSAPMRQYAGFLWFERTDSRYLRDAEFDFARSEDKHVTSEAMIERLGKAYLSKAREKGAEGTPVIAVEEYFHNINAQVRWVEQARLEAEPTHIAALLTFAERAYRRPLSPAERDDLAAYYRMLRQKDELSHEEAVQDVAVSVLMSPLFLYRMDLAASDGAKRPLTDYELASRLSYFLWASLPDQELLDHAAAGDLHRNEVLLAQTRRMLRDDRVRGLATEFAANWLDFRRFEAHNSVDRERFPGFTDELRQAMFEEPVRYFMDVVQHDRSVLELLNGRHTFANAVLAQHYGIAVEDLASDEWVRIDNATPYGRGGLLSMAVFQTQNSPGLRTSPVKRGYWVVRRLLGERIPPPPPNVPELPADEAQLGDLTLPQLLARHRDNKACAGCHQRFDAIGLTFEGFGPIGERRETDLGGRPVQTRATFPDGSEGDSVEGLRRYLRDERQQEFIDNLCRKFLAYGLGRTLLPSDDDTIERMQQQLAAEDQRFGALVETIVTSSQFLTKRGRDTSANSN